MTLLATATSLGSKALGFAAGIKTYLIVGAVTLLVGFGSGWYFGSTHEAKIMAKAAVQAAQVAQKAQADKDAKDYNQSKADYELRLKADQTAQAALQKLLATKPKVVYVKNGKVVPAPVDAPQPAIDASSMKALNDPALVGETK